MYCFPILGVAFEARDSIPQLRVTYFTRQHLELCFTIHSTLPTRTSDSQGLMAVVVVIRETILPDAKAPVGVIMASSGKKVSNLFDVSILRCTSRMASRVVLDAPLRELPPPAANSPISLSMRGGNASNDDGGDAMTNWSGYVGSCTVRVLSTVLWFCWVSLETVVSLTFLLAIWWCWWCYCCRWGADEDDGDGEASMVCKTCKTLRVWRVGGPGEALPTCIYCCRLNYSSKRSASRSSRRRGNTQR